MAKDALGHGSDAHEVAPMVQAFADRHPWGSGGYVDAHEDAAAYRLSADRPKQTSGVNAGDGTMHGFGGYFPGLP